MENPIKVDDLGFPPFLGNLQMFKLSFPHVSSHRFRATFPYIVPWAPLAHQGFVVTRKIASLVVGDELVGCVEKMAKA